jgi:hypothetical protein
VERLLEEAEASWSCASTTHTALRQDTCSQAKWLTLKWDSQDTNPPYFYHCWMDCHCISGPREPGYTVS